MSVDRPALGTADTVTPLSKLIDHCLWANENWIGFLAANSSSDEFLMKRMTHILLGERAWFQRLDGDEPDRNIWKLMSVAELRDMHGRHRMIYDELLRGNLQPETGVLAETAISKVPMSPFGSIQQTGDTLSIVFRRGGANEMS